MARPPDSPERGGETPVPDHPPHSPSPKSVAARLTVKAQRITSHPSAAHLVTATRRYLDRMGNQFAGAMTYFSLLAVVPILMVGFAVTGIMLRNNQDLLTTLEQRELTLMPPDIAERVTPLIDRVVADPFAIGIIGLLIAMFSGIGWMRNLRKATTVLWRPELKAMRRDTTIVLTTLKDLGSLTGLTVAVVLSVALSTLGSRFATQVLDWIGLGGREWMAPVITVITLLIAMAADVLIFLWIYTAVPGKELRSPFTARLRGSIVAAVALEILKYALVVVMPKYASTSENVAIFGPVIAVLFFMHLLSQMILFIAAWIATADNDGPVSN